MKSSNFTVLTIGLLGFSLTVKYQPKSKTVVVNVTAPMWEWAWLFGGEE